MSIIRGTMLRRKSRGTIQDRVIAELKRMDALRTNQSACTHRFAYSPSVRGPICIDCGKRGPKAVHS